MEQITIHINDRRKARALRDFLKSLDYVEKVTAVNLRTPASARTKKADFFAMAGIWADRDITLETLRQSAWPRRI
jgi:hypothetical protein